MFDNVLNRNAKHTESKKKKTFRNGPKSFLSRTKVCESVGNAKQSIFYFRPYGLEAFYSMYTCKSVKIIPDYGLEASYFMYTCNLDNITPDYGLEACYFFFFHVHMQFG